MPKTIATRLAIEGEAEYKRAIKNCNDELKVMQSELNKVTAEYARNADSMDALTARGDALQNLYDAQAKKVDELRSALENAKSQQTQYGEQIDGLKEKLSGAEAELERLQNSSEDTTEAEAALKAQIADINTELETAQAKYDAASRGVNSWQIQLNNAEADLAKIGGQIEDNTDKMNANAEADEKTGEASSKLSEVFGLLKEKLGTVGELLDTNTIAMGGMIAAAGALAGKIVELYKSFEKARETIVQATGATGEALAQMEDSLANVYLSVDEMDLDAIAATMGEVATRLDLTGESLESATIQFEAFAEATGVDAAGAVSYVTKVMKNWGVSAEDMEGLLDRLVYAGQFTGISVSELSGALVTNKATLQEMGYSLNDAIALLSMMEKEGINASTVMMGMKTAVKEFAADGVSAQQGFADLTTRIKEATSSTEAISEATKYFGTRAAQELVYAIQSGRFELDAMTTSLENCSGIMNETDAAADTLGEKFRGNLKTSFSELKILADELGEAFESLGPNKLTPAANATDKLINTFKNGVDPVKGIEATFSQLAAVTDELSANETKLAEAQEREASLTADLESAVQAVADARGLDAEALLSQFEGNMALLEAEMARQGIEDEEIERLVSLADERNNERESIDALTDAITAGEEAERKLLESKEGYLAKSPELVAAYEAEAAKQAEVGQWYEATASSMEALEAEMAQLQQAYDTVYQQAYESIDGQIKLFQKMDGTADQSVKDLIGALDSQIEYMDTYADNIRKAMELGVDKGLIQKLSDGSEASAKILQAIVDDGGKNVGDLNEKLALVEEGKTQFADTVAEMQTDFDTQMTAIEERMGEMVDELNQKEAAYDAASDTVQGFINGAKDRYDDVYDTYYNMAKRAQRAVNSALDIHSPSRVMAYSSDMAVEGFIAGPADREKEVFDAYEKMAKAAIDGVSAQAEELRTAELMAPDATYYNDNGYTDARNMVVNISVASASEADMQDVYDYISKNFATRLGN